MSRNWNSPQGVLLIEAVIAVSILSLITGFIIQSMAVSLRSSESVRNSFEASFLMENLLFEIKSDESGERFARTHRGDVGGNFFTPNVYAYQVDSRLIGVTQKPWDSRQTLYQNFNVTLGWKEGRENLLAHTVARTQIKATPGKPLSS